MALRPQVVISKENPASRNIKSALLELFKPEQKEAGFWPAEGFDIAEYPGSIIEIVPSRDAEYYIFASTHKSKSNAKSLTVHTPGNWDAADMGGLPRTLNTALPVQLKAAAMEMARLAPALPGWQVSVEVDHHGPTLARPVMFAEIGSTENEWSVPEAGKIVAQSIAAAIACRQEFDVKIGFGGTHYAPKFTPKILEGNLAFGHLVSGYSLERAEPDEEMAVQAFSKNSPKASGALVDWKGLKGEARAKLVSVLESCGIPWEKA